jgi:hypothetical protein
MNYQSYYCDTCSRGPCYCQIARGIGMARRRCVQAVYADDISLAVWRKYDRAKARSRKAETTQVRRKG